VSSNGGAEPTAGDDEAPSDRLGRMAIDRDYVRQEMDARETEDLVEILARQDEEEWSPEVFPLVEEVLRDRGVRVAEEIGRLRAQLGDQAPETHVEPTPSQGVSVASFEGESDAQLCRMALEQAGVKAVVREAGRHAGHAGDFEVHVSETDLAEANAILEAATVPEDSVEESGSLKWRPSSDQRAAEGPARSGWRRRAGDGPQSCLAVEWRSSLVTVSA